MKIEWRKLLKCIAIPLLVGGLSALISGGGMQTFEMVEKPSLSPPAWLFPVVWTVLYTLMGIASYLVWISGKTYRSKTALVFYGIQLAFNFLWSIIFFALGAYWFAFIWLVLLWIFIFVTTILFYRISKPAGYLMIPYLVWVAFAGYLNFAIAVLN